MPAAAGATPEAKGMAGAAGAGATTAATEGVDMVGTGWAAGMGGGETITEAAGIGAAPSAGKD